MTFVTWPLAAIAASVVIPALVILYFLKLRRRDMEVSSTLLWKKAIQDLQANAPFQKLRNNILLFLQLLVLAAALFALAQPEFKNKGMISKRSIILVDRSASMSSQDGKSSPEDEAAVATAGDAGTGVLSRLEAAKKRAIEFINAMREPTSFSFDDQAEEAMVIAFDSQAEVIQGFTSNKRELRAAIERIGPTEAPTSLQKAFDLAKVHTGTKKFEDQIVEGVRPSAGSPGRPGGFIPSAPGATIHLFSDGRLPDADRVQTAVEDRVIYHPVGSSSAVNIGITGLRAERAFDNPGRVNIFVGLQSTDTNKRSVDVEIFIDGQAQSIRGVSVEPASLPIGGESDREGQTTAKADLKPGIGGFVFPVDRPEGGLATVRITPGEPDVLPNDNVGYVVMPPAKRLSVALVAADGGYLKYVLEGLRLSKFDALKPAEYQKLLDDGQTGQYDVVIFDQVLPEVKLKDGTRGPGLPLGRSLVLGIVPPPPLGATVTGEGEPDLIMDFVRDHPALKLAELDKVEIAKLPKIAIPDGAPVRVLARGKGGPAIFEVTDSASEAIVVAFPPHMTNWPLITGFVIFMADSLLHLSQTQSGMAGETLRPGDTLVTRLPRGARSVNLQTPEGESISLEISPDGTVSRGPIRTSGVYTLSWSGPAGGTDLIVSGKAQRAVTVNLLDPAESDVGARKVLSMAREDVTGESSREAQLTRRLWPYLMLAALALAMFEWFIYNRKVAI